MVQALVTSPLTTEMIEEVIAGLPIQGRIILRLLLIQYLDITHEEILYMVADRPDPRCVSGKKPVTTMTQESITAMIERRDEYRRLARLRRERTWLQCVALNNQARTASALAARAAALLTAAHGVSSDAIERLTGEARSAVPSTTLRLLEERWDRNEIPAEEYQKHRLVIEMQTQLRFAERFKKRLELAQREQQTSDCTVLADHEIGHIWGIPAGTLAARKVKFLAQFLTVLKTKCSGVAAGPDSLSLDLWKDTLQILSRTPVERSIATYDGLERTESALLEKLAAYALIRIPEAVETKFWNSLVYGASSNAVHSETTRTLFGLQRLVAVQKDLDVGDEALDEELRKRTTPISKESESVAHQHDAGQSELTELQQHILRSFTGDDSSGRASDKW